mmetsp:Transcript_13588/g.25140  ORF Transcript_13588/g.25140 Transcript_13588/m.25140 type:complete len:129 (+) Transcript_13588:272-658(+)
MALARPARSTAPTNHTNKTESHGEPRRTAGLARRGEYEPVLPGASQASRGSFVRSALLVVARSLGFRAQRGSGMGSRMWVDARGASAMGSGAAQRRGAAAMQQGNEAANYNASTLFNSLLALAQPQQL